MPMMNLQSNAMAEMGRHGTELVVVHHPKRKESDLAELDRLAGIITLTGPVPSSDFFAEDTDEWSGRSAERIVDARD